MGHGRDVLGHQSRYRKSVETRTDKPRQGSIGMILGMDIIMLGDLAISNANGQSLFSFAIPPFKSKMDFSARKSEP
jgi:hypothetical protein